MVPGDYELPAGEGSGDLVEVGADAANSCCGESSGMQFV